MCLIALQQSRFLHGVGVIHQGHSGDRACAGCRDGDLVLPYLAAGASLEAKPEAGILPGGDCDQIVARLCKLNGHFPGLPSRQHVCVHFRGVVILVKSLRDF